MPNWNEVIHEIGQLQIANPNENAIDTIRRKYLNRISNITGWNTPELQDAVLTTHHAFMHTFSYTYCVKIIENHEGVAYIEHAAQQPVK